MPACLRAGLRACEPASLHPCTHAGLHARARVRVCMFFPFCQRFAVAEREILYGGSCTAYEGYL